MFVCDEPQTAFPEDVVLVGVKPPWKKPQVTPAVLRRSPTFKPVVIATFSLPEQSSKVGSGSPITVPLATESGTFAGVAPFV